jgi:hypothetical protein
MDMSIMENGGRQSPDAAIIDLKNTD